MSLTALPARRIATDRSPSRWRFAGALRRRHPLVLSGALACAVFVLSVAPVAHQNGDWSAYVISGALAIPLLWWRRAPKTVFAVLTVIALAQWLAGIRVLGDVAVLASLYAVASTQPRRHSAVAAGIVLVGVVLASVRFAPGADGILPSMVFLSGLALAAFFIGTTVQNRRAYLASLEDRAERLERERDHQMQIAATMERTRIAREMHDIVAHSLTVIIGLSEGAALANARHPRDATEAMHQAADTGRQALGEMRRLLGVLREEVPADASFAPQPALTRLDELLDELRAAGLPVTLTVRGRPIPLCSTADSAIYRVVQEALTNALKHAREPQAVKVIMQWAEADLTVIVVDDGRQPWPPSTLPAASGHGLLGMRERITLFGGELTAGPTSTGWRVHAVLPLRAVVAES